jgi:hypothetical protein
VRGSSERPDNLGRAATETAAVFRAVILIGLSELREKKQRARRSMSNETKDRT